MDKPTVKLVGEDGNVFAIICRVRKTLHQAGIPGAAEEFAEKAFQCSSYGEVLVLVMQYCEVE